MKKEDNGRMKRKKYEKELRKLQGELCKLQDWVKHKGLRVIIVFEGRDAAGKGGTIKRITQYMNPRITRIVALPKPTERQRTQWYFQRYIDELPAAGEVVLFDYAGEPVRRWQFEDAFPVKWSGPTLVAASNDVAIEELVP